MHLDDRLAAIVASPIQFIALLIVILFIAVLLFRLVFAASQGTERIAASSLFILRQIVREITAPDRSPAERLNGIVIICLTLLTLLFFILFLFQSVRGAAVGEHLSNPVLAAFLFCFAGTAISGIICTRICAKHSSDLAVADRLKRER